MTATQTPALRETIARVTTDDAVSLTTADGQSYAVIPVVERRAGGFRLSGRSGFVPFDVFVPYAMITDLHVI